MHVRAVGFDVFSAGRRGFCHAVEKPFEQTPRATCGRVARFGQGGSVGVQTSDDAPVAGNNVRAIKFDVVRAEFEHVLTSASRA